MKSPYAVLILCAATWGLVAVSLAKAAPPTLQHLFPPGGQRGESVEVTAAGTFDKWPARIWVSRPGVVATAAADKGKFTVSIAADAEPGVYWLRACQDEGASLARPFVVGTLDEVAEVEPNDALDQGQVVPGTIIVNGRLGKSGDVDAFQVELRAGQTLVAALDAASTLGSPMDPVMQVCDEGGFVIEQNDDARGVDPMVVLRIPRDGRYYVRLFAFPATPNSSIGFAGSDDFVYRLTLTTAGFLDYALPMAVPRNGSREVQLFGWNLPDDQARLTIGVEDSSRVATLSLPAVASEIMLPVVEQDCLVATEESSIEHPQAIQLPAVISGRIEQDGDVDAFRFAAKKGDKLLFRAESDTLGYLLDPILTLVDAAGKVVGEVDDTSRARDCELAATIPADGEYDLRIRDAYDHGGFRYVYRLTAAASQPDFQLALARETFVLAAGKPLEIEVTVGRLRGLNDEIQITAVDLPAGVAVKPATSTAKGDSAKKVKLELSATAGPVEGVFRVVGTVAGEGGQQRFAHYSPTGSTTELDQPWLTVVAPVP